MNDGGLINDAMIDVVLLGPGRNQQERDARSDSAAAVLNYRCSRYRLRSTAIARAEELVGIAGSRVGEIGDVRLHVDGTHLVIVPAVGVVPSDEDSGLIPLFRFFERVNEIHQEELLVEGVRVTGVTVFKSGRLDETDGRQIVGVEGSRKRREIVLVIGLILAAYVGNRAGRQVIGVRGRLPILEKRMVREVVKRAEATREGRGLCA